VALNEDVWVDIALKDGANEADILALSHSTSVVDLGAEHVKHFVGNIVISLHEFLELSSADNQILIGESVRDVPANRTELSSILHNGVEKAEAEQDLLKDLRLRALFKLLRRQCIISLQDVLLET